MRKPGHQGMSCSTELNGPSKTIPPRPSADIPRKTRRPTAILPSLVLPASPFEVVVTLNYVTPPITVRAPKRTERLQDPGGVSSSTRVYAEQSPGDKLEVVRRIGAGPGLRPVMDGRSTRLDSSH